jgi:hypothetical protein
MPGEYRDLTPEYAQELLDTLTAPRFDKSRVTTYAERMRTGRWLDDDAYHSVRLAIELEAVKLSQSGALMNGRHRCRAVIESGVTIKVLVVTSPHQY